MIGMNEEIGPEEMLVGLVAGSPGPAGRARDPAHHQAISFYLVEVLDVDRVVALQPLFFDVIRAGRIVRTRLLLPQPAVSVISLPEIWTGRFEIDASRHELTHHRWIISQRGRAAVDQASGVEPSVGSSGRRPRSVWPSASIAR